MLAMLIKVGAESAVVLAIVATVTVLLTIGAPA